MKLQKGTTFIFYVPHSSAARQPATVKVPDGQASMQSPYCHADCPELP